VMALPPCEFGCLVTPEPTGCKAITLMVYHEKA
jgi:hypothetical protein